MGDRASFADQLSQVRTTRFAKVPRTRFLLQSFLASSVHSEESRRRARQQVLDWAAQNWPGGLVPARAYDGAAFEHDQAGLRIAATANADGTLWAFRSEHLGRGTGAAQTWVTEAVVADLGPADAMGVRNSCSTVEGAEVPISPPRIIRGFVEHQALVDGGVPIQALPRYVRDLDELQMMVALIHQADRKLPVIVIARDGQGDDYPIDAPRVARDLQSFAHVFCLPQKQAFWLSDLIGRPHSTFSGCVRVYQPGFDPATSPFDHPVYTPARILNATDGADVGRTAFERQLTRRLYLGSVDTAAKVDELPSYFSIRRSILDKPNKTIGEEVELLRLELAQARANESEWQALAADRDRAAEAAEEESRSLRSQNQTLLHDIRRLRADVDDDAVALPSDYAAMPHWIESEYSDRLVLHARALRGLKDARFEDVSLVAKSLELLATTYWLMKTNDNRDEREALSQRWEQALKSLRLEYRPHAMTDGNLGRFRDDYEVPYRIGQTTRQVMGSHLCFGSNKDPRYTMRIYFFFDDERQLVVVGHLPSHLDTRAT